MPLFSFEMLHVFHHLKFWTVANKLFAIYPNLPSLQALTFLIFVSGLRKTKSQLSASFTSDGRYVVSAGEDSNVYIWNYDLSGNRQSSKGVRSVKSVRSCELFSSEGVSVAVPWPGVNHRDTSLSNNRLHLPSQPLKILEPSTWLWDSDFCSIGAWLFNDGISKGSATWPEEKLPASPQNSVEANDHHQHYRVHQHSDCRYHMHHQYHRLTHLSATWSLVIVTASCNGIIRSFHNYGLPVRLWQVKEGSFFNGHGAAGMTLSREYGAALIDMAWCQWLWGDPDLLRCYCQFFLAVVRGSTTRDLC